MTIASSHDTSEFACDCLLDWWQSYGKNNYPNASSILLLCDCGGSNGARNYIFKQQLERLANQIQIEIRVAHFPPYCSKYNPIEHLLFPHISTVCRGVIFKNIEMFHGCVLKANTKKGLMVFASINDKVYTSGEKASEEYKNNMAIVFDDYLPQWNYTAIPEKQKIQKFSSLTYIHDTLYETKKCIDRTLHILD